MAIVEMQQEKVKTLTKEKLLERKLKQITVKLFQLFVSFILLE